MKKITLLAIAFVAISFASCKKDRTCACTSSTTTTVGGSSTTTAGNAVSTKYTKAKKTGVNCVDSESTTTFTGGTSVTTNKCSLS
jgi:hypothetical protein